MKEINKKIALVLIDYQEGFRAPQWGKRNLPQAEDNVAKLLLKFRQEKKAVYHIQHLSRNPKSPLRPGQPGVDFMEAAKPLHGERIFQKHVNSGFIGTNLEQTLRNEGIEQIVIGGIAVDHCVSTTSRMAANLGFQVFIAGDATIAYERRGVDGTLFDADVVHAVSLASLHGEFATVLSTQAILDAKEGLE